MRMKLRTHKDMGKKEMTRYAFISHMEDYLKKLINDPLKADTDDFLKSYGIDGPTALKIVLKKEDDGDENSSIVVRKETIKDNGVDDDGKKKKDSFVVSYKIPRKDYTRKMRNAFIRLFESNEIESSPINEDGEGGCVGGEGATSADASGQFTQPLFGKPIKRTFAENKRTVYITEEQAEYLKEATTTSTAGNYQYDVPFGNDSDFYKEANDHENIMKKSWPKK